MPCRLESTGMEVTKGTKFVESEVTKIERVRKDVVTFVLDQGQVAKIANALMDIPWDATKNGHLLHGLYQSFRYGGMEALSEFLEAKELEKDPDIGTPSKHTYKYSKGDVVYVRDCTVDSIHNGGCVFIKEMQKYISKKAKITSVMPYRINPKESRYKIDLDNSDFFWTDDMFSVKPPCNICGKFH